MYRLEKCLSYGFCSKSWNRILRLATGFEQMGHIWVTTCGVWWFIGRFVPFCPKGCGFESLSSHHVGTLGKSFTCSCLWCFDVKLRHSIHAVSGAPLSSRSGTIEIAWVNQYSYKSKFLERDHIGPTSKSLNMFKREHSWKRKRGATEEGPGPGGKKSAQKYNSIQLISFYFLNIWVSEMTTTQSGDTESWLHPTVIYCFT